MLARMSNTSLFLYLQLLLICSVHCNYDEKWADPYKLESLPRNTVVMNSITADNVMAHYKRTINLILSSVIVESSDLNTYKGRLFVDITLEDYKFLKKFASINTQEPLTLQKVDQVLTKIFTKSTIDEVSDILIYWSDYIYMTAFNRYTGVYLTIFLILIIIYKLLKASYSPYQVVIYLFFLGYLLDFAFTWKRLLQELEIAKYANSLKYSELPADCKLSETSGWKFFLSFLSGASNCQEYHKIILYDVFWDVGPLDVIAHQSRIFLEIASNIGIGISKLTVGLMSELPFPLNILLLPFLLLFVLFLLWSILTYLVDTHIDLNLFHLITVKFKTNQQAIKDKSERHSRGIRAETEEIEFPKAERRDRDRKKKEKTRNVESICKKDVKESFIYEKKIVEDLEIP